MGIRRDTSVSDGATERARVVAIKFELRKPKTVLFCSFQIQLDKALIRENSMHISTNKRSIEQKCISGEREEF